MYSTSASVAASSQLRTLHSLSDLLMTPEIEPLRVALKASQVVLSETSFLFSDQKLPIEVAEDLSMHSSFNHYALMLHNLYPHDWPMARVNSRREWSKIALKRY